jgi:hypothetical protein
LAPIFVQALTADAAWRRARARDARPVLDEIDRLASLLAHPEEDADVVAGIRFKALALRILVGPPAQAKAGRREGRNLAALHAWRGSSDPAVWAGLAAFERACGNREAAGKALARAKALDPAWRNF